MILHQDDITAIADAVVARLQGGQQESQRSQDREREARLARARELGRQAAFSHGKSQRKASANAKR